MYFITDYSKKISSKNIWLTGPARSGTSIIGKSLSSLKNVEYFYEPETLYSILPLLKKISLREWLMIYETYISEDLVFNSVVGRKLNLRKKDDSYLLSSKSRKEYLYKLNNSLNRDKIGKHFEKNKITTIIKVPDLVNYLIKLKKIYKRNIFIATNRNSLDLIISLKKKNWFDQKKIKNFVFPLIKSNNYLYPIWLPANFYGRWKKYNVEERSALYVILMKSYIKKLKPQVTISFENFIQHPEKELYKICKKLNLKFSSKTIKILNSVKQRKNSNRKKNFIKLNIRSELLKKLHNQ